MGTDLKHLRLQTKKILSLLRKEYPEAEIALRFSNPLELLIATILSAQCTDERVNKVTPILFSRYKKALDYANAEQSELEQEIRSTGFFRNKAKSIIACCRGIVERHKGSVPETMEELTRLPGVGRKTANVVLGGAFGVSAGVVVDTHVRRTSQRLGLTGNDDPEKIELELMQLVSQPDWFNWGNLLIHHGRRVCHARNPECTVCVLKKLCPSAGHLGVKTRKAVGKGR